MKKRKMIILLIIGLLIGSGVTYATTMIASSIITYDNSKTILKSINVQDALDELFELSENSGGGCKSSPFKEGDYVSMTPDLTSYTILATDTGYKSDQTINPSELNMWRVIKINDDCTVDMVSSYVSSTNVYFGTNSNNTTGFTDEQIIAYKNFIGTLNKIAKQYEKSGYVVRTRNVGFNGQTEVISDTSEIKSTTPLWTRPTSSATTLKDETLGGGDQLHTRDTNQISKVLGSLVSNAVGTTTATKYWLASRYYYYSSTTGYTYFGRYVNSGGYVDYDALHYRGRNFYYGDSYRYALRPIITLGSGVKIASGDGTSEATSYQLTK